MTVTKPEPKVIIGSAYGSAHYVGSMASAVSEADDGGDANKDEEPDSEGSDEQAIKDEYTIMLIRKELEAMLGTVTDKLTELERIVTDTRRLGDLETRVDDNEKFANDGIHKNKTDIVAIMSKLKI